MTRAPNLTESSIDQILSVLDGWSGPLSWEALIDAIERRLHVRYTRQALHKHARIKGAFSVSKERLAEAGGKRPRKPAAPELQAALDRIERLEGENARLAAEGERYRETFARWSYNAYTRGLDEKFLNQPMPPVDRDRTKRSPKAVHN